VRRADNLTTFMGRLSWNLGASTSWNHQGLSRPVMGLLLLHGCIFWFFRCVLYYDARIHKHHVTTFNLNIEFQIKIFLINFIKYNQEHPPRIRDTLALNITLSNYNLYLWQELRVCQRPFVTHNTHHLHGLNNNKIKPHFSTRYYFISQYKNKTSTFCRRSIRNSWFRE
jgi:hypothetical protein